MRADATRNFVMKSRSRDLEEFRRRAHRFDVEAPALVKYDQLKEWEYLLGEQ